MMCSIHTSIIMPRRYTKKRTHRPKRIQRRRPKRVGRKKKRTVKRRSRKRR